MSLCIAVSITNGEPSNKASLKNSEMYILNLNLLNFFLKNRLLITKLMNRVEIVSQLTKRNILGTWVWIDSISMEAVKRILKSKFCNYIIIKHCINKSTTSLKRCFASPFDIPHWHSPLAFPFDAYNALLI